jgi:hypothetical protein
MMARHSQSGSLVLAAAAALVVAAFFPRAAGAAAESAPFAKVVALEGDAWVEHPGVAQRTLACGDTLSEGDVLVTGPGARAGVQAGDVFAQVSGGSQVRLGRGANGAPTVNVEKGHASVRRLNLANLRKGGGQVAPPGNCAGAPPVAAAPPPLDQLIGSPLDRFNPAEVAAGPPGGGDPGPQGPKVIDPCAIQACFAAPVPIPIPTAAKTGVVEQPPVSVLPPGVGRR